MDLDPKTTTRLLSRLGAGDPEAAEELAGLVHGELHRLAQSHMAGQGRDHTLQPTALVNEVWLRFAAGESLAFAGREPFFALASRIMRSVLVDHARARKAQKRGGDRARLTLDGSEGGAAGLEVDVLALDDALERLRTMDPELCQIVELRFFGGLSHAEVARVLGLSMRTVERRWRLARAWLHGELA